MLCAGGHTLGFAHCSSFQNRIHKFSTKQSIDPSMNPSFANSLRKICPSHNNVRNAGSPLDSSSSCFDNAYFKQLLQGKSIFSSDQALLTHPHTKALVSKFAHSQEELTEPLSRPWSRWAASSTVEEERSGSTVNSLDDWWSLSKCVYKCYISSFLTIPRWVKTWKCTYFSYLIVVINWHAYNCCIIVTLFMFHLMKKNIFYRFVIHKGCLNDQ